MNVFRHKQQNISPSAVTALYNPTALLVRGLGLVGNIPGIPEI